MQLLRRYLRIQDWGTPFRRQLPIPEMKNLIQQEAAERAEGVEKQFSASSASSWFHQQWLEVLIG